MPLEEYRRKRDFARTPEPAGGPRHAGAAEKGGPAGAAAGGLYVIQKHAARQLHYDFRIELGGVLVSWAVPKGPSLDPAHKRLAVRVEDHPVEYGSFEGSIPKGEYGGGTVELWDQGRWEPAEDPVAGLARGTLKIVLDGEKLKGLWTLVRLKPRGDEPPDKSWLLFKDKDEFAIPTAAGDILAMRPESVASGRSIDEIAADHEGAVYSSAQGALVTPSARTAAPAVPAPGGRARGAHKAARRVDPSTIPGAKRAKLPGSFEPQLATLAAEAPAGDEWIHEIKFDGYRALCAVQKGQARLLTRNGNDWTERFGPVAAAAGALPVREAVLDGEIVVYRPDGATSFSALQEALSGDDVQGLVYQVFDLLYLDGYDLTEAPLIARKEALADLLGASEPARGAGRGAAAGAGPTAGAASGPIRYTDHISGSGEAFHRQACRFALEGVVSKRKDRPYRSGRGRDWLKVKCLHRQEFVVGGFTDPAGSRSGLGALLVGYHDADERLVYAGRVGTGFSERSLESLAERLRRLERADTAFVDPPRGASSRGVHWVEPTLVAEVAFIEWTKDGALRHPSFLGLREDKPAREVVREAAGTTPDGATPAPRRATKAVTVASVALTHPGKVLYPDQGITKLELARYYESIADWVLPHIEGRPLTLVRCPDGHEGECFYQKHVEAAYPEAVRRATIQDSQGPGVYAYVESIAGIVALVQMGVLEMHTWGSRIDDLERPDRVTIDLDPGEGTGFDAVADAARVVRDGLGGMGLTSFVKTTGGKGLHVVAPVKPDLAWADVVEFTKAFARAVEAAAPEVYTANPLKTKRAGRVFVDYGRNARGATAVAAYSTRARTGAPVSVPLSWDELGPGLDPKAFTIATVPKRLALLAADPWEGYRSAKQRITARARKALGAG